MIVTVVASLFFGSVGFSVAFAYTSIALVFFIVSPPSFFFSSLRCGPFNVFSHQLRTLRPNFGTGNPSQVGEMALQKRRRNYFLLAIAAIQVVAAWILL